MAPALIHPKDKRMLSKEESDFVSECAMRTMQGHVTRGSNISGVIIAELSWSIAFEMLDRRRTFAVPAE